MEKQKVIISFVRSKVGFHLTWLKYKKEEEKKEKKLFCIYKNNYKKIYSKRYIFNMYQYILISIKKLDLYWSI